MPEIKDQDFQVFNAISKVLSKVSIIVSYLISLSFIAYLIGWQIARSYFSRLGAEWLLNDIPLQLLISLSFTPILIFAFITYYYLKFLMSSKDWFNRDKKFSIFISILFILIMILNEVFGHYKLYKMQNICSVLSLLTWSILAVSYLMMIIWYVKEGHSVFKSLFYDFIYLFIIFGFIILPSQTGEIKYKKDTNPNMSTLSRINIIGDNNQNYRLLFSNKTVFYAIELDTVKKYPDIKIFNQNQIFNIQSNSMK